MLSGRRVMAVAVLGGLGVTTASAAQADDDPVRVRGGNGWIQSEVIDPGTRAGAPKLNRQDPAPARTCTQVKSETAGGYATAEQFSSGAPAGVGPGGWVVRRCSDGSMDTAWVPASRVAVSVQQLAQRAVGRLPLPLPAPSFDPRRSSSAGPATLVAIPTSFFLDGGEPITQRTAAGAMWAVVTAEPVVATWWPGDGSAPFRCTSAGHTRPTTTAPGTGCTYTYRRSSAAQPNNVYNARVVVTWRVHWRGSGGLAGTLPLMERQTVFPVAVAERQTVIVVGRGDR